jgi:protein-S-isoprenylcysteine O-methyltransferase Ste14
MFTRAVIAFLALPGVVALLIPSVVTWHSGSPKGLRLLGLIPMVVGAAGLLTCVREFYRTGRGTLATWDPPRHLVAVGLYRYTRNPMYLSVLLMLSGWAGLSASGWLLVYAAAVGLIFHLHVVLAEEPWLAASFGETWHSYSNAVPRWLGWSRHAEAGVNDA